jgi:hypothetical protein
LVVAASARWNPAIGAIAGVAVAVLAETTAGLGAAEVEAVRAALAVMRENLAVGAPAEAPT